MNRLTRPFSFVSRSSTEEVPYVPESNEVVDAVFGKQASFFVKHNGDVYFAGTNTSRCSGLGSSYPATYSTIGNNPVKITYFSNNNINITQVAVTDWGTFFLSSTGVLYYAGDNPYVTGSAALTPTVVPASYPAIDFSDTTFYDSNMGNVSNIKFSKIKGDGLLFGAITTGGALCTCLGSVTSPFLVSARHNGLALCSLRTSSSTSTSTFSRNIVDFELKEDVHGNSFIFPLILAIDSSGLLWKKGGGTQNSSYSLYWGGTHNDGWGGLEFVFSAQFWRHESGGTLYLVEGPHASDVGDSGALDSATLTGVKVTSIALGNYYALVTTSNGELWGQGESGRFGGTNAWYNGFTKVNPKTLTRSSHPTSWVNIIPTTFSFPNIRSIAGGLSFPYLVSRAGGKDTVKHGSHFNDTRTEHEYVLEDQQSTGGYWSIEGPPSASYGWHPKYHGWAATGNHWITDGTGYTGMQGLGGANGRPETGNSTVDEENYGRDHLSALLGSGTIEEPSTWWNIQYAQENEWIPFAVSSDLTGIPSSTATWINNNYYVDGPYLRRNYDGHIYYKLLSNRPVWDETAKFTAPSSAGDVVPKVFAGNKTFGFVRNRVLYVWGMNQQGQTGVSSTDWVVGYPKAVTLP